MKRLDKIIDRIVYAGGYFSGWLVPLMMVLVFVEVFMRYVLHRPPMVADEFAAYLLVTVAYLGLAQTWKEGGHPRITALVGILPTKVASWVRLIVLVIAFAMAIALCQSGYKYLERSFEIHMRSATWLNTPLQVPQMTILIGFVLFSLLLIVEIARTIRTIRTGKRVEEAETAEGVTE